MAVEIAQAYVSLIPSFRNGKATIQRELGDAADGAARSAGASSGGIFSGSFGKALKAGAAIASIGAVAVGLKEVGSAAISAASDLGETSSKVGQIFGKQSAATIESWASTASTSFGQSKQQAMEAASQFAMFGKAAGLQGQQLTGFSTNLTQLASDLASFNNTSPEEAVQALGAALRGESEPIRKYGVMLDDATLKAEYFAATGQKVTGSLTPQQKVLAAQAAIMKQTSDAQGDFARTSGGLANSQRSLSAALEDMKAQVGQGLLPAMTSLVQAVAPLAGQLAGPLGEVAKNVGGALSKAFESLAPMLPTVATALGKIADVAGNALATAIRVLVPIFTPVMEIMSALADRVGPLLTPLLERLGSLIGKLFDAVSPLLKPLTDLVFTILDAAWPIIDMVAGVVGTLLDALAPLLQTVGQLLKPIGDLISLGFKALLPVIQPLMPLITALAAVLSNVLTRAIGVIVTALGGMIVAASKLAPFMLNNVVKPIVSTFLTFAESIVGSAETAFGWVPGLGDKLRTAKDAIGTFKTSATTAIGDAAKTIGTEGEKIGRGLIDQGVALVKDPSQVAKVKNAGIGVGIALGQGMAQGIVNTSSLAGIAAASTINKAEQAARNAAESNSPSKLFARIGTDLTAGLVEGVKAGGEGVRKALQESYGKWFADSIDKLKTKLNEAKDAFNSFKTDIASRVMGGLDFNSAIDSAQEGGGTIVDAIVAQADNVRAFAQQVQDLLARGLSQSAFQYVTNLTGDRGRQIANELLGANSAEMIAKLNTAVSAAETVADQTGKQAAAKWYGAGVTSAQSSYEGFRDNFSKGGPGYKAMQNVMDKLAAASAREVIVNIEVTKAVNEVVTRVVQEVKAPTAGSRATGGPIWPGTWLVGEQGPELVTVGQSGYVYNARQTAALIGSSDPAQSPVVLVRNYFGDREFTDLIDSRIDTADEASLARVLAGSLA